MACGTEINANSVAISCISHPETHRLWPAFPSFVQGSLGLFVMLKDHRSGRRARLAEDKSRFSALKSKLSPSP